MEILELKSKMFEMKTSLDVFNSKQDAADGSVNLKTGQ
jgi:hypothetical protein